MTDNQLDRSQDSHTYHFDSAQRFTKMERGTIGGTPSFYQGYTLDALANWSSFNNNGTSESRSHDVMNAITFRGATSLSHDLNGNLTNDGNQKYIWDELNRLVEVRDSGNNIICDYYYNANNLRVEKHHAGGAKEQFYYCDWSIVEETDGSQNLVREYVNGGQYIDEVIFVVNGSTYNYYMSHLRYCVTGFIDSAGIVVERARYDGYGKRTLLDASYSTITTANVDQSYGYTGIRHDVESGLQYYRARYFDNDLGRFVNHDPLGYVDGLNLYRGYFVVNAIDPFGLTNLQILNLLAEGDSTRDAESPPLGWANRFDQWKQRGYGGYIRDIGKGNTETDIVDKINKAIKDSGVPTTSCNSVLNLGGHGAGAGIVLGPEDLLHEDTSERIISKLNFNLCPFSIVNLYACHSGDDLNSMKRLGKKLGASIVCGCQGCETPDCKKKAGAKSSLFKKLQPGDVAGRKCAGKWVCVSAK